MIYAPPNPTDEQLIDVVRHWIDLVANREFQKAFDLYSYRMAPLRPELTGAESIAIDIERYRSASLFPGETRFSVTDWREATGGNPAPTQKIVWYKANDIGISCVISVNLPLNGKWSGLLAEFLLYDFQPGLGYLVELEDISFYDERFDDDQGVWGDA
jgi:hypothetical protein